MISRRSLVIGSAALMTLPPPNLEAAPGRSPQAVWDELLGRYVRPDSTGLNRVDYAAWKANAGDMRALDSVVAGLAASKISALPKANQFATWANLYNAITIQVVLARFPVKSIRDIKPNLLAMGPWKEPRVRVEGKQVSLDDIEHGIMRKQWRDPRVHYSVNCASIGCPNLGRRGWRAESLDADLDAAARAFINSPRGVRVVGPQKLRVSSIYQWFKVDFGNNEAGILTHLRRYAAPPLLAQMTNARIVGDDYDWSINATSGS
ncbi:DUF547 domain-containing protein [Aquidulcibacter paucihalophilus]|uniref:DUF547 domain-containing protein n=1 Tax=Aquidulcibacter paucihalophilus TaxID=1978549 RepID=UPI0012FF7B6F|nr:DUF547 domain-containing protein [Aquidulcibacter paucihalophilus]